MRGSARGHMVVRRLAVGVAMALVMGLVPLATAARAMPEGFREDVVLGGLTNPTKVLFAPDGRVFVAEKSGLIKTYDGLSDATPTVFADLRTQVHNFWDRGLLGLALHPDFPTDPRVYVLYTHDAEPGGTAPRWGSPGATSDPCPSPPGATTDGCVVTGRLSVLTGDGTTATAEEVLIEDWCQQYPSHSVGDLGFGADGALYASAGDGASFNFADWGQRGQPVNPCDDPPAGVAGAQTPPTAEGGALRSQDVRTPADPTGLDGSVLRLDPDTGEALADNPGAGDANARRIVAHGMRNPFRFAIRPGTSEVWLGDVGWNAHEEIDRLADPTAGVVNFGWPCYEGAGRQGGYDGANLDLCESLYDQGAGAHATPWFTYAHSQQFVAGDGCATGGSSAAGVAFATSGTYPPAYDGAMFYADYSRDCIWVLPAGTDGLPDPAQRAPFVAPAANPVDLEIGPDGNLYYVDFLGGSVRRISYFAANQPPVAAVQATPVEGPAPLEVAFDASGSTDPDGDPLTYAWDLDDDGQFDDGATATVSWTYDEPGDHRARVRVSDPEGATDTAQTTVSADNTAPAVTIGTPAPSLRWAVDDTIAFSGSATDAQDGAVSDLSWQVRLHHCVTPEDCHVHVVQTIDGTSGSLRAPDHEYPAWLELRATATDSGGLTDTASVRLDPQTVDLTVATDPPGLVLALGDDSGPAPLSREVIVGSANSVSAPSPQTVGGTTYEFASWSDGGASSHTVTSPSTAQTLTATFTEVAPPSSFDTRDIGAPALAGSTTPDDADTFTVSGAGNDIWNAGDQFHYASQALDGDGSITARVVSQTVTNPWAKAGVMIRDGFGAGARHAMLVQTPGNGVAFQWRQTANGSSSHQPGPSVSPPQWLKLVRIGDEITGYTSVDAATWVRVGATAIAMGADVRIGLAVTSHSAGARSTAVFDNVVIGAADPPPPPPPPVCPPGQWSVDYFANRTLSGDPVLRRCEAGIDHDWGSGGPGGGVGFDDFSARWSRTVDLAAASYEFTARADDGVRVRVDDETVIDAWRDQAATTYTATRQLSGGHTITMEYYERGGQAVAQLDWTGTPVGQLELGSADIGAPGVAGSTVVSGSDVTVIGGGADIWGTSDQFQYGYTALSGDGTFTARVATQTDTDPWAKAGVMIRESLAPGSRHAMVVVTPGNGTAYQCRLTPGASSLHSAGPAATVPRWVRVQRRGDLFIGSVSADGDAWTEISRRTIAMPADVLVGLAVTSHSNATSSTATFTDVALSP